MDYVTKQIWNDDTVNIKQLLTLGINVALGASQNLCTASCEVQHCAMSLLCASDMEKPVYKMRLITEIITGPDRRRKI